MDKELNPWDHMQPYTKFMRKKAEGKVEANIETLQCKNLIKEVYETGMKVLDVGCGAGHYLYILKQIDEKLIYIGIDQTKYSIEQAREVFEYDNLELTKFINVDIQDIWGLKPVYDIVFCFNFLLHLEDYHKVLENMLSLTKKYLFIRTYLFKTTLRDKRSPYLGHVDVRYVNKFKIPYIAWDKKEMIDFIKSKGDFEVEEIQDYTDYLIKMKGVENIWKILKVTRN